MHGPYDPMMMTKYIADAMHEDQDALRFELIAEDGYVTEKVSTLTIARWVRMYAYIPIRIRDTRTGKIVR